MATPGPVRRGSFRTKAEGFMAIAELAVLKQVHVPPDERVLQLRLAKPEMLPQGRSRRLQGVSVHEQYAGVRKRSRYRSEPEQIIVVFREVTLWVARRPRGDQISIGAKHFKDFIRGFIGAQVIGPLVRISGKRPPVYAFKAFRAAKSTRMESPWARSAAMPAL